MKKINLTYLHVLAAILLLSAVLPANAQRWYHVYQTNGMYDQANDVDQTSDGGFILGCNYGTAQRGYLLKTDANGLEQWRYQNIINNQGTQVIQTPDNGYVLGGGSFDLGFSKVDASGAMVWEKSYNMGAVAGCNVSDMVILPDSSILMSGYISYTMAPADNDLLLVRADQNGDTLWTRTYNWADYVRGLGIRSAGGGEYFVVLQPYSTTSELMRINANGDSLDTRQLTGVLYSAEGMQHTSDGGYIAAGIVPGPAPAILSLDKLDANGNIQWSQTYPHPSVGHYAWAVTEAPGGGYVITGCSANLMIVMKVDNTGNSLWYREYDFAQFIWGIDVIPAAGGGFAVAGKYYDDAAQNSKPILFRLDDNGLLFTNLVTGNVYKDVNDNCIQEPGDAPKAGWTLSLAGPSNHVTTTDSAGNYEFWADTGSYTLTITNAGIYWDASSCSFNSTPVTLTAGGSSAYDTTAIDFPRKSLAPCPIMNVDISTPLLRRCFNSTYYVSYCNEGTEDALNATVDVVIDSFMTVVSSSIPVASQNGDTLTFSIGNVAEGDCGSFSVTVYLSCAAVLGQTHCVEAYGYPDSLCLPPNPLWDQASVFVEGDCRNDSVEFKIRNRGIGNMLSPENYYITEENIMLFSSPFQLPSADSIVLSLPANGSTYRLQAGQSDYHPWNEAPVVVTIEGCGLNNQGTFTVGLFNALPEYDYAPFHSQDCQENVGAYDPNDKAVFPAGYGAQHFITADDRLEYKIRFQNTGTDTAFTVVVRDTLSAFLDPATVKSGASSHPYTFRIYDSNILEWTFSNILLPDSNVDEPGSNGFIKFSVAQIAGNPAGTVIPNSAAIYFDFNEPVITNETWNTIAENFIAMLQVPNEPGMSQLKVFPNPFSETTTIVINGQEPSPVTIDIIDLAGKTVRSQQYSSAESIVLSRAGIPAGVYIVNIYANSQLYGTARLIIQ